MKRILTPHLASLLTSAALLLAALPGRAQTLTSRSPQPNTSAAPRAGAVTATFSQPLNPATVGGVRVQGSLRQGRRAGTATASGSTLSFQPTVPFLPGEEVQVTLPASVQGAGGAAIAPQVYQFRAATSNVSHGKFTPAAGLATTATSNVNYRNLLTGDLDNDGDLDIVAVDYPPGQGLPVMRGYFWQNGGFVAGQVVTGSNSLSIMGPKLCDADGDGDLDLLSVDAGPSPDVLTIWLNDGAGLLSLTPALSRALTGSASELVAADLDGDGDPDLHLTGYNSSMLLFNNGAAGFTEAASPLLDSSAQLAGDLDEDGDLDFIGVYSGQQLALYRNQGNGIFDAPVPLNQGATGPYLGMWVQAILDINGDHHPDVAYDGFDSNMVHHTYFALGPMLSGNALVLPGFESTFGDVDGDGDMDYVHAFDSNLLTTMINDGQGNLTTGFTTTLPAAVRLKKTLGDFDGDGDLDLLGFDWTGGVGTRDIQLYLNQPVRPIISSFSPTAGGAGTVVTITGAKLNALTGLYFNGVAATITGSSASSVTVVVPAGASTGPITATDADGTGTSTTPFVVNLKVLATTPPLNGIAAGTATPVSATFSEAVTASGVGSIRARGSQQGPLSVAVSGAGTAQLGLALTPPPLAGEQLQVTLPSALQSSGGTQLVPYSWQFWAGTGGTGAGNFQPGYSTTSPGTNGPKRVVAADLNHDGAPDLVALQPDAPDENVLVALNTGSGTLGTPTLIPVGAGSDALALADVNQDGHLDLLTTSKIFNNNTYLYMGYLNVRLGNGSGGFSSTATSTEVGNWLPALAVGDVNNDGRADVVALNRTTNAISSLLTFLGGPTGLSAGTAVAINADGIDVALADVNNDGKLDALAASLTSGGSSAGRVSVRLGDGGGLFSGSDYFSTSIYTAGLAVGDLNGDHLVDVVTVANNSGGGPVNEVQIAFGSGSGTFSTSQTLSLSGRPYAAILGDIDADGDLDVLVASGNAVQVLRNDGGILTLRPAASAGSAPQHVALADLDGDGDLDLAAANYGGGNLVVRYNTPGPPPPPSISSFSPGSGGYGSTITVNGTGFTGATDATVNSQSGFFLTVISPTQLTFTVPYGATSGLIDVTTPGGTATSTRSFTVLMPPSISSFSPTSGPVGTVVTISGSSLTGVSDVSFNGTSASTFTVDSNTQVTATVPAGATTGYVLLTAPSGSAGSAQQFTVTGLAPTINVFSPNSGPVGTVVTVGGSGFTGATAVSFNGTNATSFTINSDTQLTATVPIGASTGPLRVTTPNGQAAGPYNFTLTAPPAPANDLCTSLNVPTLACGSAFVAGTTVGSTSTGDPTAGISTLTPSAAAGGVFYKFVGHGEAVTVSLCGSTFGPWGARLFVYSGSCGALSCIAADANSCPNTYPQVSFTALSGSTYYLYVNGSGSSQGQFLIGASCDLTVNYSGNIPAGTYQNLIITPLGSGTLGGPVVVQNQLQVQSGGSLFTSCQQLTGAGSFSLGSGSTLGICDANGLGLPGSGLGAVKLSGTFSLSPEARYLFNGMVPQSTGAGFPAQAQAVVLQNPAGLTLSGALSLSQLLRLNSGNLGLNGQLLTLLSSASGTALINNAGGQVLGSTGRMQRWISPSLNPGSGYRHFSPPVSGCAVQQLAAPGYTPVVNAAYNASAAPANVVPFPSIFSYDQSRITSSPATGYSDFDKGWQSPASLSETLQPGRGYTVQLPASALSTFQGTFNNGSISLPLSRGPQAEAGWQLLGNPYPAPIDWDAPGGLVRNGVDDALYVFESSGPYAGQYRAYVNGVGTPGANLVAAGQGFFVRVSAGQSTGSLTFNNAARLTDFSAGQPSLHRSTADLRPQLALRLGGTADETFVYFEAGATAAFDAAFDAHKLPNPGNSFSLSTELSGETYAVNGLPLLAAPVSLPLSMRVPRAGSYALEVSQLLNFAAGQTVVLRDALTNTRTPLTPGNSYAFTLTGTDAPGRFWLEFAPAGALANANNAAPASLQVFPNPSHTGQLRLVLPLAHPLAANAICTAELRDALGRVVRPLPLVRPAQALLDQPLDLRGVPAGVYLLRVQVAEQVLTRRLVLE